MLNFDRSTVKVLRIFKMIVTIGFLTGLECTKFVFGRGPPRTPLGELTVLPRPLAGLRGSTSKGKREGGKAEWKGR